MYRSPVPVDSEKSGACGASGSGVSVGTAVAVGKGVLVADGVAVGEGTGVGAAVGVSSEQPATMTAIAATMTMSSVDAGSGRNFLTRQLYGLLVPGLARRGPELLPKTVEARSGSAVTGHSLFLSVP